jgi:large conductance mechanosensitive channel
MSTQKQSLLSQFKEFALRGDLLDLAVAFIIGLAFKAVVDALVNNVIMPIVGAVAGKPSFDDLTFRIGDGVVKYGLFINAIVNFLIIAATLFVIVKTAARASELRKRPDAGPPELRDCPFCFTEIPARATRCPSCTSAVDAIA